jgi:hypothetical protein
MFPVINRPPPKYVLFLLKENRRKRKREYKKSIPRPHNSPRQIRHNHNLIT